MAAASALAASNHVGHSVRTEGAAVDGSRTTLPRVIPGNFQPPSGRRFIGTGSHRSSTGTGDLPGSGDSRAGADRVGGQQLHAAGGPLQFRDLGELYIGDRQVSGSNRVTPVPGYAPSLGRDSGISGPSSGIGNTILAAFGNAAATSGTTAGRHALGSDASSSRIYRIPSPPPQ